MIQTNKKSSAVIVFFYFDLFMIFLNFKQAYGQLAKTKLVIVS